MERAVIARGRGYFPPCSSRRRYIRDSGAEGQDRTVDTRFFSRANRRSSASSEIHNRIRLAANQRLSASRRPPQSKDEGVRLGVIFASPIHAGEDTSRTPRVR